MKKPILMLLGGAIALSGFAFTNNSEAVTELSAKKNEAVTTKAVEKGYKHKSDIAGINTIQLDEEDLQAFGIRIANGHIYQSLAHGGYVCYTKTGTSFPEMSKANRHYVVYPKPILVTDDLGNWRSYKCQEVGLNEKLLENSICTDEAAIARQLNQLIPVLVKSGEEYTFIDKVMGNWRPDVIFWFENTEQVQSLLQANW